MEENLIEIVKTTPGISPDTNRIAPQQQYNSAFWGMGGSTRKELSAGLAIDVLLMILVMRLVQIKLGLKTCFIVLANETTRVANGFPVERVDGLMKAQRRLIEIALNGLGIDYWLVFLESEMPANLEDAFQQLLPEVSRVLEEKGGYSIYVARETALVLAAQQCGWGDIKVGWHRSGKMDGEAIFDSHIINCLEGLDKEAMSFVYCLAAPRLSQDKSSNQQGAPYILTRKEIEDGSRILLKPPSFPKQIVSQIKSHGKLTKPQKEYFISFWQLFSNVVLKNNIPPDLLDKPSYPNKKLLEQIEYILSHVFREPGSQTEAEEIWKSQFGVSSQKGE